MRIKKSLLVMGAWLLLSLFVIQAQNRPFPQNVDFPGCIKPQIPQADINQQVLSYYEYWKMRYVKSTTTVTGGYIVELRTTGAFQFMSYADIHARGMIITAVMGDKQIFDGMYKVYDHFRSTNDEDCMTWGIPINEDPEYCESSQTEGDLNIAYALLLAHKQWGSNGTVNYYAQACRIIYDGIKSSEISPTTLKVMMGDWGIWFKSGGTDLTADENTTRPNDWMSAKLRAFYNATHDDTWLQTIDAVFDLTEYLTANYAPYTGLVPGYVVNDPPQPAPDYFFESEHDGDYSWNSSLFPMHMALDYAHSGEPRAKAALDKIITWVKSKHGHPKDILAGYTLDGIVSPDIAYDSMAFTAPLIAACIVDSAHQQYLNWGWEIMVIDKAGVFEDTINLMCQLIISGNLWEPNIFPIVSPTPTPPIPLPGVNQVVNGDFSDTSGVPWTYDKIGNGAATLSIVNGELHSTIDDANTRFLVKQDGLTLTQGGIYEFSFIARADVPQTMTVMVRSADDQWKVYSEKEVVQLTTALQRFSFKFTMMSWADFNAEILFIIGNAIGTVAIDNVCLKVASGGIINKAVYSSGDFAPQYSKKNAIDGNDSTVWGSKLASTGSQWIFVDLGQSYNIHELVIKWFGKYYARKYSIGFSNDAKNWTLTRTITKSVPGSDTLTEVQNARYVGILCTQANDIAYGIAEIEVWGN